MKFDSGSEQFLFRVKKMSASDATSNQGDESSIGSNSRSNFDAGLVTATTIQGLTKAGSQDLFKHEVQG
ncbi:MAG: hypothetical protein ACK50W_01455 [bacterium]